MNRFEKVITVINNSCDKYRFYLSEAEIGLIAKDLLTSGIFENKIIVDELKQGEVKAKLFAIFGKTICSDLDTEDITDIIDELLKEYDK